MPEGIVTYSYDDSTGALVRAELGEESLAFSWDGPLATGVSVAGTVAGDVSVTYDEALRITQESVSGSDVSFRYDYGRLIQAGEENIGYADAQRIQSRSHGTVTESLSYSSDYGELVDHDVSVNNTTLYQVSFERDALGRITQRSETVQGEPLSVTYGYDVLGRLVSTNDGTTQHTYRYDPNGNRLDDGAGFDSRDRLIRRGGATYAYTADGYLASRTDGGVTTKYVYDRIGQLRSLSKPGQTIEYVIDPLGRRIAKKVGGTLKQGFLYDLRGRVIAELDGDGALVSRFVYGAKPHVPDYLIQGNTTLQIITDERGSPRLVIDVDSGNVVQRMDYDAWGNVLRDTHPGLQPFGFAGGLWDADTGLVRFGARDTIRTPGGGR